MMPPSVVRAIVVLWEVKEDTEVVGGTPVVRKVVHAKESHQVSFYTEGPADEREVIRQYTLKRPAAERPALNKAWLDGLLRAYDIQPKAIEKPQVPLEASP